jgi:hypothetical protein
MTQRKADQSDRMEGATDLPGRSPVEERSAPSGPAAAGILDHLQPAQAQNLLLGQGNRQSQHLLTVQRWSGQYEPMDDDRKEQKRADTALRQSAAADIASKAYAALDRGLSGGQEAVRALAGHSAAMRSDVKREFHSGYGTPLLDMVLDKLCPNGHPSESGIYALALLESSHVHDLHVAVAMAILPTGEMVRNAELDRILTSVNAQGVPAIAKLRELYGNVFWRAGAGSLPEDLKTALSGAEEQRALALIDHRITPAEELYKETIGVMGAKSTSAVNRIFAAWDKGPAEFGKLELDWELYVRNKSGWTDEAWTDKPLRDAMLWEFNGTISDSNWKILEATFDGYDRYRAGISDARKAGGPAEAKYSDYFTDDPDDPGRQAYGLAAPPAGREDARHTFLQREFSLAIQLEVAKGTYEAAVAAGNEEQVVRTAESVGRIHDERKAAARDTGDESLIRKIEHQAERDLKQLKGTLLKSDVDADSVTYQKSRLLLEGSLDMADRVWLATKDDNADKTTELITGIWAQGKMMELRSQAGKARFASDSEHAANRVKIRPEFEVGLSIPDSWGDRRRKITHLLEPGTMHSQGANRLWYEIEYANDKDAAVAFLQTPALEWGTRFFIAAHYVQRNFTDEDRRQYAPGGTDVDKFVAWFSARYENAKACIDLADLLTPARTAAELVERAEKRYQADASWFADVAAVFTGEDSNEVAAESLERLRFIAGSDTGDIGPLMILMGAASPMELATMEYDLLKSRLADIAALKKLMAETLATLVESAVKAFVTAALGPGGVLAAALAANVAGMLVREAALGAEYKMLSTDNALTLAKTVAGQYTEGLGGKALSQFGLDEDRLKAMGRVGSFASGAVDEVTGGLFDNAVGALYNSDLPDGDAIAAGALDLALSAVGGGAGKAAAFRKQIDPLVMISERDKLWDSAKEKITTGLAAETAAIAEGISDLTPGEIGARYANRTYGVLRGMAMSKAATTAGTAAGKPVAELAAFGDELGETGARGFQLGAEDLAAGKSSSVYDKADALVAGMTDGSPRLPSRVPDEPGKLIPFSTEAEDTTADVFKLLEELEKEQEDQAG